MIFRFNDLDDAAGFINGVFAGAPKGETRLAVVSNSKGLSDLVLDAVADRFEDAEGDEEAIVEHEAFGPDPFAVVGFGPDVLVALFPDEIAKDDLGMMARNANR